MPTPTWWPEIVAAAGQRRRYTGQLLTQATPVLNDGVLRLQFNDPDIARAWRESGAQAALEAAMAADGIEMPVRVASSHLLAGR